MLEKGSIRCKLQNVVLIKEDLSILMQKVSREDLQELIEIDNVFLLTNSRSSKKYTIEIVPLEN